MKPDATPCNPHALPCVHTVMEYIGEIGTIPSPDELQREKAAWVSYMTWCGDFCLTADYTDEEALKNMYHHPWAVTKDQLPTLY